MKKLLCISVLAMGLILMNQSTVNAQQKRPPGEGLRGFGIEGGVNISDINGIDAETQTRLGLMAGLYYRLWLASGPFYLQPELLYTQKGYERSFEGSDITFALDYLTLNVLLAYYVQTTGAITPFFKLGPYLAFNVLAKEKFEGQERDLEDIKSTDFGVIARAGVAITKFEVGVRLAQGLTNIIDNGNSDQNPKNFVIAFFVGFHLF